jgi:hypothetical protein
VDDDAPHDFGRAARLFLNSSGAALRGFPRAHRVALHIYIPVVRPPRISRRDRLIRLPQESGASRSQHGALDSATHFSVRSPEFARGPAKAWRMDA